MAQLGRGLKWCRKRFLESQFIDQVGGRERFQVFESGLQSALNLAQLQDDKLSAPKPQKPCKAHGFLTLCMLQGNPPPLTQHVGRRLHWLFCCFVQLVLVDAWSGLLTFCGFCAIV